MVTRAPSGERVQETPDYRERLLARDRDAPLGSPFVNPLADYGQLKNPWVLPMSVKLQMLADHRVALALAFIRSPMIRAAYDIDCPDEEQRQFLKSVWSDRIHQEYMTHATLALALGRQAMVKKWRYQTPHPTPTQIREGIVPWRSSTTPIIVTGFRSIYPEAAAPVFKDGGQGDFAGIQLKDSEHTVIPVTHALWIVRGLAESFGHFEGSGRLLYCYNAWWGSRLSRDIRLQHIARFGDRPLIVRYPPGRVSDDDPNPQYRGKSYREVALDIGSAYRAGATVVVPSEYWRHGGNDNVADRAPKWDFQIPEINMQMAEFQLVRTQDDEDVFMGMLVPPQAITLAKESLGGTSVAEIMGNAAVKMLDIEMDELYDQVTHHIFPQLLAWNYGASAAPARLISHGVSDQERKDIQALIWRLATRRDLDFADLDIRVLFDRAGMPLRTAEEVEREHERVQELVEVGRTPRVQPFALSADDVGASLDISDIADRFPDLLDAMVRQDPLPHDFFDLSPSYVSNLLLRMPSNLRPPVQTDRAVRTAEGV